MVVHGGRTVNHAKKVPRWKRYLPMVLLLAILVYALAYSIKFLEGPSFFGDDIVYAQVASTILQSHFVESSFIFSVRLLMIYPIAFFFKFFGVSILTSSAWDVISFIGMIAAVFFIGREVYNDYAGLMSALLLSFFPLIVQLSTTVSDDLVMAFITSLAILALVIARKRNSKAAYFATGVFMVASPLVTPEGFIIIMVVAAYLIIEFIRRKIKVNKTTLYLLYGLIAAGIVLMAVNYTLSHNPLITLTVNSHFYSAVGGNNTIPSTNVDPGFYFAQMFPYRLVDTLSTSITSLQFNPVNIWNSIWIINYNTVGFYFYFLVAAILYLIFRKERRAYVPLLWFLVGFGYLEFGPMHVSLVPFQYLLSYRLTRFLTMIAVPTVLVIGIAFTSALERSIRNRSMLIAGVGIVIILLSTVFLIGTAIPTNVFWYQMLYSQRYDQLAIGKYLATVPLTTPIYFFSTLSSAAPNFFSAAFSNVPLYMQFKNQSRIFIRVNMTNCSEAQPNSYIVIPKYQHRDLPSQPLVQNVPCPQWQLVLYPQSDKSFPDYITSAAVDFEAALYYNPATTSSVNTASGRINQTATQVQIKNSSINYYNLTGVGNYSESSNGLNYFYTVNNVSAVNVSISADHAGPGNYISVNVLFIGKFDWTGTNQSVTYLNEPLINVHYFGVEFSNQTGHLLDQDNGPWYNYLNVGQPSQHMSGPTNRYLLINWSVSPTNLTIGKSLKICGGYFATYENTTVLGGWSHAFDILSGNQTSVVNRSVISVPSKSCDTLQVT